MTTTTDRPVDQDPNERFERFARVTARHFEQLTDMVAALGARPAVEAVSLAEWMAANEAARPQITPEERHERLLALWRPTPPELIAKLARYTGKRDTPKAQRERHTCKECGAYHEFPCVHLDYVGHADTTRLIAAADPCWSWMPRAGYDEQGEPIMVRDANGYPTKLWIWLDILGVVRPGVGTVGPGKDDPEKELIGDGIRNCAMRYGVAADLWSKALGETASAEHGTVHTPPQSERAKILAQWAAEPDGAGDGEGAWDRAAKAYIAATAPLNAEQREQVKATKTTWGYGWPMAPAQWRRMMDHIATVTGVDPSTGEITDPAAAEIARQFAEQMETLAHEAAAEKAAETGTSLIGGRSVNPDGTCVDCGLPIVNNECGCPF